MSGARRLEMIRHHPDLSLACQCALLGISRSSLYYQPTQAKVKDLEFDDSDGPPVPEATVLWL